MGISFFKDFDPKFLNILVLYPLEKLRSWDWLKTEPDFIKEKLFEARFFLVISSDPEH